MEKLSSNFMMLIMLIAALGVISCGGDDNDSREEALTLNATQMELTVGDKAFITSNIPCTYSSDQEDVATILPSGQINAVGAGNAIIKALSNTGKQSATCSVVVNWKYSFFDEPLTDFSLSINDVKAKETHKFEHESFYEAATALYPEHTVLYFEYFIMGEYTQLDYYFYGKSGSMYKIVFDFNPKYSEHILNQMEERYGLPTITTTANKKKIYTYKKKNYQVSITENKSAYWLITYEPID